MQRLVEVYIPENAPVRVRKLTCLYQAQKEGVYANIDFEVVAASGDPGHKSPLVGDRTHDNNFEGLEAVEFTFVLLDIFDNFLLSIQGIAGPGRYAVSGKKHKARWVFDLEGAFSQYHALCFPSQARFLDGRIWRCSREECIDWLNVKLRDAGIALTEEDVFPENAAREGIIE